MAPPAPSNPEPTVTAELTVTDRELLVQLSGPHGGNLRTLERVFGVSAGIRGDQVILRGDETAVAEAQRGLTEILTQLAKGRAMRP